MVKQSQDRRARRSRRMLKESLLELMKRKRFSEISVRDVTDGADMNRGTFYLHYTDTADLLQSLEADLFQELQALIDDHIQESMDDRTLRPVLEPILDCAADRREVWEVLLSDSASTGFLQGLQALIRRNGAPLVEAWFHPQDSSPTDYLLTFLAWGFTGLLREWFQQEMRLPREELIRAAVRLAEGAGGGLFPETQFNIE
ncbi:MAG: TetR/AcrR family transcriptional regulator [Ruminiclostridium sp.]|jgi:AcrR family transcriptional regulator|nr:TetR/AcrR family transcriptional regulator [Ruminiclostridium sp.]